MSRRIFVSLLPSLLDASRLAGGSAIVIDVLRASTTICAALKAGATRVIPFASVDDARRFVDRLAEGGERPLLGGERGGVRIEGFDLGNSPLEYTSQAVAGRTIVFTTTNGTRALLAAGAADRIYIGAFANVSAIANRVAVDSGDIHLICAGTDGQVTLEDVVCAGTITATLRRRDPSILLGNDEAMIALASSVEEEGSDPRPSILDPQRPRTRLDALRSGLGGLNLVSLGYDADIEFCARTDSAAVVPIFRDGALVAEVEQSSASAGDEWAI